MGNVYRRWNKLWIWYLDAAGKRVFEATSCAPGEEARARKILEAVERRVEAERRTGVPAGELTVKAYGEQWMKGRPGQGVVTAEHEARRLRLHAWPLVGHVPLKDLRPHHIRDMVRALRAKKSAKGTLLAPRTVRHVYGSLHTMLHDAVVDELIPGNPCVLKKGELPRKVDKDPEWRGGAVFTRDEVEHLISDPRIPEDRRTWNALLLLTGLRFGEASALRWRHLDTETKPLGRLTIAVSWNSELGVEGTTKTETPRVVPVHPTLGKVLAAWKLGGFPRLFGRPPQPDDLLIPNRNGEHRDTSVGMAAWKRDLQALGFRHRRQHDTRRTFTTLGRADGARKDLLEWITHGPGDSVIDAYTTLPFDALCAEVAKLKVDLHEGATVIPLESRRAVGAEVCDSSCDRSPPETKKPPSLADSEALSTARSRGLEGGETGRASQGVEGTGAESLGEGEGEVGPRGSSADGVVTGVTPAQLAPGEVTAVLATALANWSRTFDAELLRRDLGEVLALVTD